MKALSDLEHPVKLTDCQLFHWSYVKAGQGTQKIKLLWIVEGLKIRLLVIAAWIAWPAIGRFQTPVTVFGIPMLIVTGLSLVINGFTAWLLQDDSHHDLNLQGAFLH